MAIINGTRHNDTLVGTSGDDFFQGFQGKDSLTGNGGSDTFFIEKYHHSQLPKQDTIEDFGADDFIQFGAGVYGVVDGQLVHVSWADVTIETLDPGEYRVHVALPGTNEETVIDVVGVQPVEASFIFFT